MLQLVTGRRTAPPTMTLCSRCDASLTPSDAAAEACTGCGTALPASITTDIQNSAYLAIKAMQAEGLDLEEMLQACQRRDRQSEARYENELYLSYGIVVAATRVKQEIRRLLTH